MIEREKERREARTAGAATSAGRASLDRRKGGGTREAALKKIDAKRTDNPLGGLGGSENRREATDCDNLQTLDLIGWGCTYVACMMTSQPCESVRVRQPTPHKKGGCCMWRRGWSLVTSHLQHPPFLMKCKTKTKDRIS